MTIHKEELGGVLTLGIAVKTADGILAKGTKVKITADNEVGLLTAATDFVTGYVLVPNDVAGGKATIVTRFKRMSTELSAGAYTVGDYLNPNAAGKWDTAALADVIPAGVALEAATGADQSKLVLWF